MEFSRICDMKVTPKYNMKTIDLYSGIGGWHLGLNMAGIDVPYSYEMWEPAIETCNGNFGTKIESTDIRDINLGDLNELMCLGAISGAEMAMRDVGIDIKPGSGIAAAEEYYRETAPNLPND